LLGPVWFHFLVLDVGKALIFFDVEIRVLKYMGDFVHGWKYNSDMRVDSHTKEKLVQLKAELAEYLVERKQLFEDNHCDYPNESVTDVNEYLTKINKNSIKGERACFVIDEISKLTDILLEYLEEYQSPTTPGL